MDSGTVNSRLTISIRHSLDLRLREQKITIKCAETGRIKGHSLGFSEDLLNQHLIQGDESYLCTILICRNKRLDFMLH